MRAARPPHRGKRMMMERAEGYPKRVVVIGGGVSGLAAAHRLLERSRTESRALEILLLEASARTGGVVRTTLRDGFLLEGGPDSFISEKPEAIKLTERLGLSSRLIETNPEHRRSFIVRKGRLLPVPEGFQLLAPSRFWPFVTTGIFSWPGKARMALDLLLPRRAAHEVDDESLAQFVRRRLGREALERMAQPMVGGIYTADPERLSLRATMPRFLSMEREHRSLICAMWRGRRLTSEAQTKETSGARYSLFLSFDGGMQTLTDELTRRLPPDSIRLNHKVEQLSFDAANESWLIQSRGANIMADAVCLALPSYSAAALLRASHAGLADELEQIPYASTATVNLAYRRRDIPHPLDGFGFVVPSSSGARPWPAPSAASSSPTAPPLTLHCCALSSAEHCSPKCLSWTKTRSSAPSVETYAICSASSNHRCSHTSSGGRARWLNIIWATSSASRESSNTSTPRRRSGWRATLTKARAFPIASGAARALLMNCGHQCKRVRAMRGGRIEPEFNRAGRIV